MKERKKERKKERRRGEIRGGVLVVKACEGLGSPRGALGRKRRAERSPWKLLHTYADVPRVMTASPHQVAHSSTVLAYAYVSAVLGAPLYSP